MPDFRINVIVDPSGANRGAAQVDRRLNQTASIASRTGSVIRSVFAFAGITAGITGAIGLIANFEQQISTVRAVAKGTEADFRALTEEAQRLGATTRFSASQAAEGMVFLGRAGFNAAEVMATVGDTLLLAQAGGLGLARAADIASNVLTGFRLETDQASRVVDVLAVAANSANTDVNQLGDALKFVAPVAAGLGVELEDTVAAVGALSNAGLQASLAGTGLRRILAELESPAKKTTDILSSLGVTADEVKISQVGLVEALSRLRDAGLDTGQALEAFGDRGGPAFDVLKNALPDVIELQGALEGAGGTARRIADIMDDNLNGALLSVRSALESIVIAAGEAGASSALRSLAEGAATAFRAIAENIETAINALESLAFVLVVQYARTAIPAAIAATRAFTAALLANPIGAIATGLTIAIGLVIGFADQIKVSADGLLTLQDVALSVFEAVGGLLTSFLSFAARVITTALSDVPATLEVLFVRAFNGISRSLTGLLNGLIGQINRVSGFLGVELLGEVQAFQIGVSERGATAGRALDEAFAEGFRSSGQAFAAFDAIEARAREIAQQRDTEAKVRDTIGSLTNAAGAEGIADIVSGSGGSGATPGGQLGADLKVVNAELETTSEVLPQIEQAAEKASVTLQDGLTSGLQKVGEEFSNVATLVERSMTNAFRSAEDAAVEFFMTGKLGFSDMVASIQADLTRLAVRQAITAPAAGFVSGGGLQALGAQLAGAFFGTPGMANGGSFTVGGRGGTDRNMLSLNGEPVARVSKGEAVNVTPNGGGQRPINVIFNVTATDANSFQRSQDQIASRAASAIRRADRRNN